MKDYRHIINVKIIDKLIDPLHTNINKISNTTVRLEMEYKLRQEIVDQVDYVGDQYITNIKRK